MKMKPHDHWQFQRLTALFLVFALLLLVGCLFHLKNSPYHEIILSLKNPAFTFFIALTIMVCLYHAVLGAQVIIADYVKGLAAKILVFFIDSVAFILMLITLVSLLTILFRS